MRHFVEPYTSWISRIVRMSPKYRVFHGFGQPKFPDGGLFLGSSQFSVLLQLPQKMMLSSKEVKSDS